MKTKSAAKAKHKGVRRRGGGKGASSSEDDPETERRMRKAVRSQGRLSKKGGIMMNFATASEFQVASTEVLEKLVNNRA
jgi:ATP-dependent RNA helicase DDX31/DBP7